MHGFSNSFCIVQGFYGFFAITQEIFKGGSVSLGIDAISSLREPCTLAKNMDQAQSESISDEDKNLSEQRIRDRFYGYYG